MIQRNMLRASQRALRSARPSTFLSAGARPQPFIAASIRKPQQLSSIRWYSDAAPDAQKEDNNATEAKTPEESADLAKLKETLEKKDKEIIDLKDKYLRSIADFRNLQTQTKREVTAAKSFALQSFARDLIESVDNLDRALTNVPGEKLSDPSNKDLLLLHDGLKMTENILMQTLKKHGLERVDPSVGGEKFDPNVHEAVFQTPQQGKEDGTVFHTQQKGFMLNGRVLRAAKVGVVRNS